MNNSEWLSNYDPSNEGFWNSTGKKIAWKTLTITTTALLFSFATWFLYSVIVIKLPQIGYQFSDDQLFWLAAMPGLAGGILRIVNTFLIPIYGTKKVISITTFIKIIPLLMLGFAVMDPNTSFQYFMVIGFLMGIGGGDFSSYMPSTSLFFPKKEAGTALGIQAGIGNFGVSLVQLLSPLIMSLTIFSFLGGGETIVATGKKIYLENIAFIYIVPLFITGIWAWFSLKSIPVMATFREQLDIFKDKHTLYCTMTYIMTFGIFAGLSASFPLMIKNLYVPLDKDLDPLQYAFYGPLIGSATRIIFGKVADKIGGAFLTQLTGLCLILLFLALIFGGYLTPTSKNEFNGFLAIILCIFFFTGIGNAATFKQYPVIFSNSPRKAAGVIGWTAAVAAFGPFVFNVLISQSRAISGDARLFFWFLIVGCVMATFVNWYFYTRKGCERPC
ncbi:NNP family nitrate/nitrite transporter-like MFS transporter [Chryseobacterium sediminis]|uniref:NNP family nitrate/nitrite transporter-like MFS transporter n=1 Tax=Chryseobacterium sediminis TaxID=1679494 RepID=A0ABR6PYW9_9FLAO|nr:MFS transporter [Chryseobacterium sediminis]MBB6330906.1 NNP family nitrate/nitrite transporter-like MFS transporter [Chryseobacterium sediminis]